MNKLPITLQPRGQAPYNSVPSSVNHPRTSSHPVPIQTTATHYTAVVLVAAAPTPSASIVEQVVACQAAPPPLPDPEGRASNGQARA